MNIKQCHNSRINVRSEIGMDLAIQQYSQHMACRTCPLSAKMNVLRRHIPTAFYSTTELSSAWYHGKESLEIHSNQIWLSTELIRFQAHQICYDANCLYIFCVSQNAYKPRDVYVVN